MVKEIVHPKKWLSLLTRPHVVLSFPQPQLKNLMPGDYSLSRKGVAWQVMLTTMWCFCFVYALIVSQKKKKKLIRVWNDMMVRENWVNIPLRWTVQVFQVVHVHIIKLKWLFVAVFTQIVPVRWLNEWVWYFLNLRPNKALKTWYAKITPHLCSDKCVVVVIFTLQSENASQMTLSLSVWSD